MTEQTFCPEERKFFDNMKMDDFMSEFFTAVDRGYLNAVQYLIEYNAFVGAKDELALRKAVRNRDLDMVKLLIEYNADPTNIFKDLSENPIKNLLPNCSLAYCGYIIPIGVLEYLFEIGVEPERKHLSKLLVTACDNENPTAVKFLVEHNADPQTQNNYPLYWASGNGNYNMVKFLLENKADVNSRFGDALYTASGRGDIGMIELLLHHKADISANDNSALRITQERGKYWTEKFLISKGATLKPKTVSK